MTIVRSAKDRTLLITGFLLIAANLRVALTSVGPVLEQIRSDVGLSASAAGFIGTLPLLTFAACSPLIPRLARRFGTDQLLWAALPTLAAGIILRSLPVAGFLWLGTVLIGAAIAVGNVLLPSLAKRDFPDHIGIVTGIYTAVIGVMASTAAGVAVPLAGVLPGGWRTSLGLWAGLTMIAFAVWSPKKTTTREPAPAKAPWRSTLAWEVAIFMALSACGFYTVLAWYPSVLHSYGMSEVAAGWMLFVYNILGVVMSLTVPLLLRKLADQRLVAAGSSMLALVGYLGLLTAPGLAVLWVICTGIAAGSLFLLALAFFSLRAKDPRSSAALAGMGQAIGYVIAAIGPVLFGVLHDATGGWRVPLAVMVGVAAVHTLVGLRAGRDAHC